MNERATKRLLIKLTIYPYNFKRDMQLGNVDRLFCSGRALHILNQKYCVKVTDMDIRVLYISYRIDSGGRKVTIRKVHDCMRKIRSGGSFEALRVRLNKLTGMGFYELEKILFVNKKGLTLERNRYRPTALLVQYLMSMEVQLKKMDWTY